MAPMQLTTIEAGNPTQTEAVIQQAAHVLREGGLVVFPTETVYGVAAAASSDTGVEALRELKAQGQPRTFAVHLPDAASAGYYVDLTSAPLRRLIRKVFPGPVTLRIDVAEPIIARKLEALGLDAGRRDYLYEGNTVTLRCPDHVTTQRILGAIEAPVIAGAASLPGRRPAQNAGEAVQMLGDRVNLVIDGGRCRYAKPSTVVRVTGRGPSRTVRVEREGVYDERSIRKLMRWTVLLLCSGNTCRSPMAAALTRRILAEQRGIAEEDLEAAGVRVLSAGVSAAPGMPAAAEAIEVVGREGMDLNTHRSRPLTPELVHEADVIYTMTEAQRRAVLQMTPAAAEKIFVLDPQGDVDDPVGGGVESYERAAERIRRTLEQRLQEQQP